MQSGQYVVKNMGVAVYSLGGAYQGGATHLRPPGGPLGGPLPRDCARVFSLVRDDWTLKRRRSNVELMSVDQPDVLRCKFGSVLPVRATRAHNRSHISRPPIAPREVAAGGADARPAAPGADTVAV